MGTQISFLSLMITEGGESLSDGEHGVFKLHSSDVVYFYIHAHAMLCNGF